MNDDFTVPVQCRICGSNFDIKCNEDDFTKWKKGEGYIQDLLSYLSKDQRELLISGTCGKCFDEMFPPLEEEEEEDDDVG